MVGELVRFYYPLWNINGLQQFYETSNIKIFIPVDLHSNQVRVWSADQSTRRKLSITFSLTPQLFAAYTTLKYAAQRRLIDADQLLAQPWITLDVLQFTGSVLSASIDNHFDGDGVMVVEQGRRYEVNYVFY